MRQVDMQPLKRLEHLQRALFAALLVRGKEALPQNVGAVPAPGSVFSKLGHLRLEAAARVEGEPVQNAVAVVRLGVVDERGDERGEEVGQLGDCLKCLTEPELKLTGVAGSRVYRPGGCRRGAFLGSCLLLGGGLLLSYLRRRGAGGQLVNSNSAGFECWLLGDGIPLSWHEL